MKHKYYRVIIAVMLILVVILSLSIGSCSQDSDTANQVDTTTENAAPINRNITVEKAFQLISENPDMVILDVRTPEEYDAGHIENAVNIDFYDPGYVDELKKLDRNETYLVYCRTANRSGYFVQTMEDLGFTDMYNMLGGISEWTGYGYPVVK